MPARLVRRMLLGATIVFWVLMCYLTHAPRLPVSGPSMGDKSAHLIGYAILSGLLYLTLWIVRPGWRWTGLWVLGLALLYGVVDELTQPYFHRSCDIRDWVADLIGSGAAVGLLSALRYLAERRSAGRVAA